MRTGGCGYHKEAHAYSQLFPAIVASQAVCASRHGERFGDSQEDSHDEERSAIVDEGSAESDDAKADGGCGYEPEAIFFDQETARNVCK